MNTSINYIIRDKFTFWGFFGSILLLLITIIYIIVSYPHLPPFLPLYNKLQWGYGRLGEKNDIFIPIVVAVAFLSGNILSSSYVYPKIPLLSRLICLVAFFLSLFTCIFIVEIINLIV